jgi:hypothetical protein
MNTRHKVLDWFRISRRVITLCPVLIYYAIEIGSSLFLSGSFRGSFLSDVSRMFFEVSGSFGVSFDLSSMWIYPLYL